ncbi:protein-tyrosine phosphatase-like protein, partial [Tribonema minus]
LFLGGADCSLDYSELRSRGITHIINCTRGVCADARLADFTFLRVAVEDCPTVNISEAFEPACALIGTARDAGGATLVHCRKGISRSATIVLAWLVKHEGMTALDALRYLQSCRPLISPNAGFMAQLLELEQALRGQTTIDMDK